MALSHDNIPAFGLPVPKYRPGEDRETARAPPKELPAWPDYRASCVPAETPGGAGVSR